jgi:hypothetical protein
MGGLLRALIMATLGAVLMYSIQGVGWGMVWGYYLLGVMGLVVVRVCDYMKRNKNK